MQGFYERIPFILMSLMTHTRGVDRPTPTTNNSTTLSSRCRWRTGQHRWNTTIGTGIIWVPELTVGTGQSIRCFAKDNHGNLYVGGDFMN